MAYMTQTPQISRLFTVYYRGMARLMVAWNGMNNLMPNDVTK